MNRTYFKNIILLLTGVVLLLTACRESTPKSQKLAWSPDGTMLAVATDESDELLLVEIQNDKIKSITKIDSCNNHPEWSADGKYILYTQSSKKGFKIKSWSLEENKINLIKEFKFSSEKEQAKIVLPQMSPVSSQILIYDWRRNQLLLSDPNGSKLNRIQSFSHRIENPQWSADGQWINFSQFLSDENEQNGLWRISAAGAEPQQVYKTNRINSFQNSPDGQLLAINEEYFKVVAKHNNVEKKEKRTRISIITNQGEVKYCSQDYEKLATEFHWSPDSRQVSYLEDINNAKNVRSIQVETGTNQKLTFENADELFGWGAADKLLFSKKLPEKLIDTGGAEQELLELSLAIMQESEENRLIIMDNFKAQEIESNVYGANYNASKNYLAYFKQLNTGFLASDVYCAVLQLPNQEPVYLARTPEEHLAASDVFLQKQDFRQALYHLNQAAGFDLASVELKQRFNIGEIFYIKQDTAQIKDIWQDFTGDLFLRAVLVLRQLNQNENAEWLFRQYQEIVKLCITHQIKDIKNNYYDEVFWRAIRVYGQAQAFETGINDFEAIRQAAPDDSLLAAHIYLAQALFAKVNHNTPLSFDFIKKAIRTIPGSDKDANDLFNFTLMLLSEPELSARKDWEPLVAQMLSFLKDNNDAAEVYEMVGDLYSETNKPEKAYNAYQHAVNLDFDQHKIWENIFELSIQVQGSKVPGSGLY